MRDQLWRSASSVASNIAEGAAHDSHAQFARYLTIALGSGNEVESHLALAVEARALEEAACERLATEVREIKSMLWALRERVRNDPRRHKKGS